MGMSASQMRYCMLAGKKSDVEFQGQQINQQRTTLATETSAYNNQLLNLNVPTPPSSDDYTKTSYSFSMNGHTYNVAGTTYDDTTGTYTVNTTYNITSAQGETGLSTYYSSTTGGTTTTYYSGSTSSGSTALQLVSLVDNPATTDDDQEVAKDKSNLSTIFGSGYASGTYYKYTVNGTIRYVQSSDLVANANTGTNTTYHYVNENATKTVSSKITGAKIDWSQSGRMESITDSNGKEYSLNVTTETDENAYKDAMNEYEYKKNSYEQEMAQINAKICVIEADDKKLELKLQDLDTQQQALNTEMDSVKKVVDKNIEQSFKAFA